jgi:subtilisin family serine protease
MPENESSRSRRHMHPKLRQFDNCSIEVISGKAEVHGSLKVNHEYFAGLTPPLASAKSDDDVPKAQARRESGNYTDPDRQAAVEVNVFIRTVRPMADAALHEPHKTLRGLATRTLSLEAINSLADDPEQNTIFVEPADSLKPPRPKRGATSNAKPPKGVRPAVHRAARTRGKGVIIGIIDVEGFDWTHPDFLVDGKSRFHSIWDQGADSPAGQGTPSYGRIITAQAMAAAQKAAKAIRVSPHDLEPQSQMSPGSHGTHVASIAAGANGICPEAQIAAVLISLPEDEMKRRMSFYDSSRLLDAIHHLLEVSRQEDKPISINISLGTNGHAHDGSSVLDRWIDALLAEPRRSICVAAGNAGQERPEAPGDIGYMTGRIHASGTIAAQGLSHILQWEVIGDGRKDASENEMELWFEPGDRFAISLKPPGGDWIGPVEPGQFLENFQLADRSLVSIYNELHHPANGSNYTSIFLTPFISANTILGVPAGTWEVRLDALTIRDGRFHAWIERDDPAHLGDDVYFWPSFFAEASHVDSSTVSSLACGDRIISVANLDEGRRKAHITSSQGPTRNNREKPDIIAPGTDILAANGFGDPKLPHISMTGTSMASPFVAGVAGLMLEIEPQLTAAQILGIIKATARPLPGSTYRWINDTGFGVIDPVACVKAARTVLDRRDLEGDFKSAAPRRPPGGARGHGGQPPGGAPSPNGGGNARPGLPPVGEVP